MKIFEEKKNHPLNFLIRQERIKKITIKEMSKTNKQKKNDWIKSNYLFFVWEFVM